MTIKQTKSQQVAADIAALLRARNPLIWIVTREEARVERYIFEAAASANYVTRTWDCAQGVVGFDGKNKIDETQDIGSALAQIEKAAKVDAESNYAQRYVWVLRDLPVWISGAPFAQFLRQLRNLSRSLPSVPRASAQAIIVLSPNGEVPAELAGHATVIEWPLPDRDEVATVLDAAIASLPDDLKDGAAPNGTREAAIDAAVGLTSDEAAGCYAKSLVQLKRIDPVAVSQEKKRVIARERVLEWVDPVAGGLDAVGGLDVLKVWLGARKSAYSPAARAYGLPSPKGMLLVGHPGTGKSLVAKTVSAAWGIPLLRLDLGALKSKFVGESEGNLRKALRVIEAIGPCVIWLDEIEKALQGATSGSADGGVSADALGAILSWMQERQGGAFVIATANNIAALPPELLRKGRFDEIFFVDLPNVQERAAIIQTAVVANGRKNAEIDAKAVADATNGFTGSEIAALVPEALFAAFGDGAREITTADIVAAAKQIVPLSVTAKDKIDGLREWAKTKARKATSALENEPTATAGRAIDL